MRLGPIALKLRLAETRFENRIFGVAELALALEYTLTKESAFVIQLNETASANTMDNSINQKIGERFAVIVALANDISDKDKVGLTAYDSLFAVRAELLAALLGWQIPGTESLVSYGGGRVAGINRAYLWYQFEFVVETRIDDDDGVDVGADDLPPFDTIYAQYMLSPSAKLDLVTGIPVPVVEAAPFPVVEDTATSKESANTVNHTVNAPSGIVEDELLLLFFVTDGIPSVTDWDGFTPIFLKDYANQLRGQIAYKKATGSEGATFTIVTDGAQESTHICMRISGIEDPDSIQPVVSEGLYGVASSAPCDPDSLTLDSVPKNFLWFAFSGWDRQYPPNYFPLPDNQVAFNSSESGGSCSIGICSINFRGLTLNPIPFQNISGNRWVTCTLAIHPVASSEAIVNAPDMTQIIDFTSNPDVEGAFGKGFGIKFDTYKP